MFQVIITCPDGVDYRIAMFITRKEAEALCAKISPEYRPFIVEDWE